MGAYAHLSRGFQYAYTNIGISAVLVLVSFFANAFSGGIVWPATESVGILMMVAIAQGRRANWQTVQEVLNNRMTELFLMGLVFFGLNFGMMIVLMVPMAIGIAVLVGVLEGSGSNPVLVAVAVGIFSLLVLTMMTVIYYFMARLMFAPYLVAVGGHNVMDALRESWRTSGEYGGLRILWILFWPMCFGMLGIFFCIVGYFFTWPVFWGTVASIYREVFMENIPEGIHVHA